MATRYAGQRPWEAQPQDAADLLHDLQPHAVLLGGSQVKVRTAPDVSALSVSAGAHGRRWESAGDNAVFANSDDFFPLGEEVTLVFFGGTSGGYGGAIGLRATDGAVAATPTIDAHVFLPYSGDGAVYWRWGGSTAGTSSLSVPGLTIAPNDLWCFTAGPRGMEIWQNGVLVASQSGHAGRASSSAYGVTLGAAYSNYTPVAASTFLVATFARQLDPSLLSRKLPWQLFAPQSSRAPVAAGGAPTSITCGVGAASAQGHGVGIAAHTVVSAGVGAATATGHQAIIVSHTAINTGVGAAAAAGHQATITVGSSTAITCGTGAATAQGHQAAISLGTAVACGTGAAAAAGHQAAIATHTVIAAGVGAASAQGLQAGIALHTVIACGAGAASATGAQATIGVSTSIACGVGHAGATGHQATITVGNGTAIGCGTGAATAQGHAATVGVGASIACAVGAAVASGYQAGIAQRTVISGNVAQATAQGMQAGIVVHAAISTGVGAANARGYPATVTVGGITPEYPLCLTVEISAETVLHVRTGNPVSTIDVLIQADTRFKPKVLSC